MWKSDATICCVPHSLAEYAIHIISGVDGVEEVYSTPHKGKEWIQASGSFNYQEVMRELDTIIRPTKVV